MFATFNHVIFLGLIPMMLYVVTGKNLVVIANNGNGDKSYVDLNTHGHEIVGIASLGTKLYVVCGMNDTIFEFAKRPPYALTKTFRINGMGPGDIVADRVSKQLFIIDWRPANEGGTRVWRFNPSTGQHVYYCNGTRWTGTLALSPGRKVIGVSGDNGVNLFSSKTGLTRFQLPAPIFDPQHAIIPMSSGEMYVSYGGFWNTNRTSNVVMLNHKTGTVLHSAKIPLNWPRYMAFDTRKKNLFVTDYCHRRVVRFNSQLSSSSVVLSKASSPSVGWPQRLLLDKSTKKLYVAMAITPIAC